MLLRTIACWLYPSFILLLLCLFKVRHYWSEQANYTGHEVVVHNFHEYAENIGCKANISEHCSAYAREDNSRQLLWLDTPTLK